MILYVRSANTYMVSRRRRTSLFARAYTYIYYIIIIIYYTRAAAACVYRIGRGGLDARACRPLFFHRYDFYFFRLRAFCSAPARSRAGTVAITSTHCAAVTLYTRAGDSPLAARARGNSFSALPPLLPYIIARALYARRVYTYTWRAVYTLCVAYICTCCTPSKTYPRGSRLAAAHLNINIRICMYI